MKYGQIAFLCLLLLVILQFRSSVIVLNQTKVVAYFFCFHSVRTYICLPNQDNHYQKAPQANNPCVDIN